MAPGPRRSGEQFPSPGLARSSLPVCACARITGGLCVPAMHCRLPHEGPRRISSYAAGVIEIAPRTGLRPPLLGAGSGGGGERVRGA